MRAKKTGERWDYILKADRELDKSEQTVFTLQSLSHEDYFTIQNLMYNDGGGSVAMATLLAGLVDWQNMRDEAGVLIPFKIKDERCDPAMLDYIISQPGAVPELVIAIRERAKMDDGEQKNLSSEDA